MLVSQIHNNMHEEEEKGELIKKQNVGGIDLPNRKMVGP